MPGDQGVHEALYLEALPGVLFQGMAEPEILPLLPGEDRFQEPQFFFDGIDHRHGPVMKSRSQVPPQVQG